MVKTKSSYHVGLIAILTFKVRVGQPVDLHVDVTARGEEN